MVLVCKLGNDPSSADVDHFVNLIFLKTLPHSNRFFLPRHALGYSNMRFFLYIRAAGIQYSTPALELDAKTQVSTCVALLL